MKKFEVFKRFKNRIYLAFTTGYPNRAIEETNNLIKVMKHVAYRYRNFKNQDYQRIFLYPAHYKVKNRFHS